jgi:hypothetical protein
VGSTVVDMAHTSSKKGKKRFLTIIVGSRSSASGGWAIWQVGVVDRWLAERLCDR